MMPGPELTTAQGQVSPPAAIADRDFAGIEQEIDAIIDAPERMAPQSAARLLLSFGEQILATWVRARGGEPTMETREGFRLLALHRQGSKGEPSFNACRETCRELVYHYNLIMTDADSGDARRLVHMQALVARHLLFFVGGKLDVEGLGEFCCAAKPVRRDDEAA